MQEKEDKFMSFVLFGQMQDPNIEALRPHFDLFLDQAADYTWDLNTNTLVHGGKPVTMRGFFGRANVFSENTHQRYNNWYLMANYLKSNPEIACYNRKYDHVTPIKAANLRRALDAGLKIPRTIIGKGPLEGDCIVKPLTGGLHCQAGNESFYTGIIQHRMTGTNRRLFLVGDQHFGFKLETTKLDYRDDPHAKVLVNHFSPELVSKVRTVARGLGLTFCAADFMDDVFLEVNSGPMFAAFNTVVDGALAKAIRSELK